MSTVGIPIFDTLLLRQCGQCGVWFAIPIEMDTTARREGGFIYCPNGHQRGWKKGAPTYKRPVQRETVVIVSHPPIERVPAPVPPVIVKPEPRIEPPKKARRYSCPACAFQGSSKASIAQHKRHCKALKAQLSEEPE